MFKITCWTIIRYSRASEINVKFLHVLPKLDFLTILCSIIIADGQTRFAFGADEMVLKGVEHNT